MQQKFKNLFAYAKLKPKYDKGEDYTKDIGKDSIHGDLYKLNNDGAAKNIGSSRGIIDGEVEKVTDNQIKALDKIEKPEFIRKTTNTIHGRPVEVYEYNKKLPKLAKHLRSWNK